MTENDFDEELILKRWQDLISSVNDHVNKEGSLQNIGVPIRNLASLYSVASICYERHALSIISDHVYGMLCDYLLENHSEAVRAGASFLEQDMLRNHRGYDLGRFILPYHDIAMRLSKSL